MSEQTDHNTVHMSTHELITAHGYVAETHHVWTEDCYLLEMHRVVCRLPSATESRANEVDLNDRLSTTHVPIERLAPDLISSLVEPRISATTNKISKPPVILHHGLLSSSADWVLLGPEKGFAYVLCDSGYDVWLANARGNTYSKYHKHHAIKDREFWDFSWHEIGYYDLPALVDYILKITRYPSLFYIGYSQGTTAFYVMASERPEYNVKIKAMISLAPIAFLANQRSPLIKVVARFYSLMEWGSLYCNIHHWFPRSWLRAQGLGILIRNGPTVFTKNVCTIWLHLVAGFGSTQLDTSMLPLIFGHFPAGSSAKQLMHYSQSVLSGSFQQYDYGESKNLKLYGTTYPPKYNLEKVKVPVVIFYSENDFLTDPSDVERLADNLPNVIERHKIEYSKFNHIDYLWGVDAKTLVYNRVIKSLNKL